MVSRSGQSATGRGTQHHLSASSRNSSHGSAPSRISGSMAKVWSPDSPMPFSTCTTPGPTRCVELRKPGRSAVISGSTVCAAVDGANATARPRIGITRRDQVAEGGLIFHILAVIYTGLGEMVLPRVSCVTDEGPAEAWRDESPAEPEGCRATPCRSYLASSTLRRISRASASRSPGTRTFHQPSRFPLSWRAATLRSMAKKGIPALFQETFSQPDGDGVGDAGPDQDIEIAFVRWLMRHCCTPS